MVAVAPGRGPRLVSKDVCVNALYRVEAASVSDPSGQNTGHLKEQGVRENGLMSSVTDVTCTAQHARKRGVQTEGVRI